MVIAFGENKSYLNLFFTSLNLIIFVKKPFVWQMVYYFYIVILFVQVFKKLYILIWSAMKKCPTKKMKNWHDKDWSRKLFFGHIWLQLLVLPEKGSNLFNRFVLCFRHSKIHICYEEGLSHDEDNEHVGTQVVLKTKFKVVEK